MQQLRKHFQQRNNRPRPPHGSGHPTQRRQFRRLGQNDTKPEPIQPSIGNLKSKQQPRRMRHAYRQRIHKPVQTDARCAGINDGHQNPHLPSRTRRLPQPTQAGAHPIRRRNQPLHKKIRQRRRTLQSPTHTRPKAQVRIQTQLKRPHTPVKPFKGARTI